MQALDLDTICGGCHIPGTVPGTGLCDDFRDGQKIQTIKAVREAVRLPALNGEDYPPTWSLKDAKEFVEELTDILY